MMDEMKRETSEGERLVSLQVPNKEVVSLLHSSLPPAPYGVSQCVLTVDVCLCVSVQLCNAGVDKNPVFMKTVVLHLKIQMKHQFIHQDYMKICSSSHISRCTCNKSVWCMFLLYFHRFLCVHVLPVHPWGLLHGC